MDELLLFLSDHNVEFNIKGDKIITFENQNIVLHFNKLGIDDGSEHQNEILDYQKQNIHCIQLWDFHWRTKPEIIKSRLLSILGKTKKVFARKCFVRRIDQPTLQDFLLEHHQIGQAKSRVKYGIYQGYDLIGVAGFSNKRSFKEIKDSTELIRYCTALDITITGGLSKCINKFIEETSPKHIMSYCDLSWSTGNSYTAVGFEQTAITKPIELNHENNSYYNCGNLKFERYI